MKILKLIGVISFVTVIGFTTACMSEEKWRQQELDRVNAIHLQRERDRQRSAEEARQRGLESQRQQEEVAQQQARQAEAVFQAELARTTPNNPSDFRVEQNREGGITITRYTGTSPVVIIPETISSIRVTEIAERAFKDNRRIQKVVIPNSVTNIGAEAFYSCTALAEVILSNSITHIRGGSTTTVSNGTFHNCSSLTSITIPNSVSVIESFAFYGAGLTSVVLSNRLTSIGGYAFENNKLTAVQFPSSLRTIGRRAFFNNRITSLVFPEGVIFLNMYSFGNNPIVSLVIPSSLAVFETQTGAVNSIPTAGFRDAFTGESDRSLRTLTRITLPSNVDERNMTEWTGNRYVNFEDGLINYWKSQNRRAGTYIKEGQIWRLQ